MYMAVLDDGRTITGDRVQWHDLPQGIRIASLGARIAIQRGTMQHVVCDELIDGFEYYGFQMYSLQEVGGSQELGKGLQFICVSDGRFLTVDVNLTNGIRRTTWRPLAQMTYRRDLLRPGVV